jgi:hypothetical protein
MEAASRIVATKQPLVDTFAEYDKIEPMAPVKFDRVHIGEEQPSEDLTTTVRASTTIGSV